MTLAGFDIPGITSNQAAAGAAVLALVISIVTWLSTRKTAREAVAEAKRAADAAEDSALHARRSADAAEATAELERDARHDLYAPTRPALVPTRFQKAAHAGGTPFGRIVVDRDYRMTAIGRFKGGSRTDLVYRQPVRAKVPFEFHVEGWAPDRDKPEMAEVEFRFWPPAPGDDVEGWSCPCGKESGDDGHWRFVVPIAPPPPKRVDAEWQAHLVDFPSHERYETLVPHGWYCQGDANEACEARSSNFVER